MALIRCHRGGVDDRAAFRHVRQHGTRQIELTEDVGAERAFELIVRQILQPFAHVLLGRVVHQDVDATEGLTTCRTASRAKSGLPMSPGTNSPR